MALKSELKELFRTLSNDHKENLNSSVFKTFNVISNTTKIDDTSKLEVITYSLANDNFTLNITYSCGDGRLIYEQSVLDSYIYFTKNNSELMFSIYDVLRFIDKENFKCYTIYNVNTEDRLKDSFKYIVNEIVAYAKRIDEFTQNGNELNTLFKDKCIELQNFFGPHIFSAPEIRKLPNYSIEHYYYTRFSKFNDKAYNCYLDGNYNKALALFKKRTRLNEYEYGLLNHLRQYSNMQSYKTGKQIYEAIPSNLRYKNEHIKPQCKNKPLYSLVFPASFLFFTFMYALLFRFFRYISYRGSYFLISDSLSNRLTMLIPAFFTAVSISTYIKQNMLIKDDAIPLELRTKLGNLIDAETIKKHRRRSVTSMFIVSIICIALGANNSVAFYDIGIKDSTNHLLLKNDFYLYSEIETVYILNTDNTSSADELLGKLSGIDNNKMLNESKYVVIKLKKDEKLDYTQYDKLSIKDSGKLQDICKDNNIECKIVSKMSEIK